MKSETRRRSRTLRQPRSKSLWEIITEKIYQQWRANQAKCQHGMGNSVDIIATKQNADQFHKLLKRKATANCTMPKVVRWCESSMSILAMTCRTYASNLIFSSCTVNVLIPDDKRYTDIFAIPDYQSNTYFCFLTMKRRAFPKP